VNDKHKVKSTIVMITAVVFTIISILCCFIVISMHISMHHVNSESGSGCLIFLYAIAFSEVIYAIVSFINGFLGIVLSCYLLKYPFYIKPFVFKIMIALNCISSIISIVFNAC